MKLEWMELKIWKIWILEFFFFLNQSKIRLNVSATLEQLTCKFWKLKKFFWEFLKIPHANFDFNKYKIFKKIIEISVENLNTTGTLNTIF